MQRHFSTASSQRHAGNGLNGAENDLPALKLALRDRLEDLAEVLLGPPNKETRRHLEWRWGSNGSKSLERGGAKRGAYFNHESGEGGYEIEMIKDARACGFREALAYAKQFLGWSSVQDANWQLDPEILRARAEKRAEQQHQAEVSDAFKASRAADIAAQATELAGTVAERYLIQTRGIPRPEAWPDSVRFHARSNSLLLAATTPDGEVRAVQRVHLTADGHKISAEEAVARGIAAIKQTDGRQAGTAVRLPSSGQNVHLPLLLAEGPETGLSVWASTGYETWIGLGSVTKLDPPVGRRIVVCRDDDARNAPADKRLRDKLAEWKRAGITVSVATPWATRRFDKSDFNDVIKEAGADAVKGRLESALATKHINRPRMPAAGVSAALRAAETAFFAAAAIWVPPTKVGEKATGYPVHAIKVDVGAGKSTIAIELSIEALANAAEGAARHLAGRGDIVIAVPTHLLSDELAGKVEALCRKDGAELTVRSYRGRTAVDPRHPDAKDPLVPKPLKTRMCRNPAAVEAAEETLQDIQTSACRYKTKLGEVYTCPFYHLCGTQDQLAAEADIWIVPHELLFTQKPACIGTVAMLIVDEAIWSKGLRGVEGKPDHAAIGDITARAEITTDQGIERAIDTDRLRYLRDRLFDSIRDQPDGPLMRSAIHPDLNSANAGEAYKLEWQRKVKSELYPGMPENLRKAYVAKASKTNKSVARMARVWKRLGALLADNGPEASGWLQIAEDEDKGPGLRIKGRDDLAAGWEAPTLLLDATLDINLARYYWPEAELVADLMAEAPHQHVRQVTDRAFSKAMIDPNEKPWDKPGDLDLRIKNLRDLHAVLMREARRYAPERVLIICQKVIEEALPLIGPMPANVELAHHNAIAGRDEWGPQPGKPGVRALIIVGRTIPDLTDLHRLTEALTGIAVERLDTPWYPRVDVLRERLNGEAEDAAVDQHPHPIAEAIRWQVCEGELVQIIGRPRGVWRDASNPIDILLLTDVVVPVPVAEVLAYSDLKPSAADLMMAAGLVAFETAGHAASFYPALWKDHKAARNAFERGAPLFPKGYFLKGDEAHLVVTYQVSGPGQRPSKAKADVSLSGELEARLAERLGELAWFQIEVLAPSAPPEPEQATEVPPPVRPGDIVLPSVAGEIEPGMIYPVMAVDSRFQIVTDLFRMGIRRTKANNWGRDFPRGDPRLGTRLPDVAQMTG